MENVHLIVGLGNPEAEYARTRHNAGFLAVERLAAEAGASWSGERRLRAKLARARIGEQPVLLALPQTGMNVSGEAVRALMDYFQVPRERLLVIVDDADLPVGQLRLRRQGSSGGHHGLESIEAQIGSREYARQRLGIGRSAGGREITDYVLGKFSRDERELFDKVLDRACDQMKCWVTEDVGVAMTRFNGAITMTKEAK